MKFNQKNSAITNVQLPAPITLESIRSDNARKIEFINSGPLGVKLSDVALFNRTIFIEDDYDLDHYAMDSETKEEIKKKGLEKIRSKVNILENVAERNNKSKLLAPIGLRGLLPLIVSGIADRSPLRGYDLETKNFFWFHVFGAAGSGKSTLIYEIVNKINEFNQEINSFDKQKHIKKFGWTKETLNALEVITDIFSTNHQIEPIIINLSQSPDALNKNDYADYVFDEKQYLESLRKKIDITFQKNLFPIIIIDGLDVHISIEDPNTQNQIENLKPKLIRQIFNLVNSLNQNGVQKVRVISTGREEDGGVIHTIQNEDMFFSGNLLPLQEREINKLIDRYAYKRIKNINDDQVKQIKENLTSEQNRELLELLRHPSYFNLLFSFSFNDLIEPGKITALNLNEKFWKKIIEQDTWIDGVKVKGTDRANYLMNHAYALIRGLKTINLNEQDQYTQKIIKSLKKDNILKFSQDNFFHDSFMVYAAGLLVKELINNQIKSSNQKQYFLKEPPSDSKKIIPYLFDELFKDVVYFEGNSIQIQLMVRFIESLTLENRLNYLKGLFQFKNINSHNIFVRYFLETPFRNLSKEELSLLSEYGLEVSEIISDNIIYAKNQMIKYIAENIFSNFYYPDSFIRYYVDHLEKAEHLKDAERFTPRYEKLKKQWNYKIYKLNEALHSNAIAHNNFEELLDCFDLFDGMNFISYNKEVFDSFVTLLVKFILEKFYADHSDYSQNFLIVLENYVKSNAFESGFTVFNAIKKELFYRNEAQNPKKRNLMSYTDALHNTKIEEDTVVKSLFADIFSETPFFCLENSEISELELEAGSPEDIKSTIVLFLKLMVSKDFDSIDFMNVYYVASKAVYFIENEGLLITFRNDYADYFSNISLEIDGTDNDQIQEMINLQINAFKEFLNIYFDKPELTSIKEHESYLKLFNFSTQLLITITQTFCRKLNSDPTFDLVKLLLDNHRKYLLKDVSKKTGNKLLDTLIRLEEIQRSLFSSDRSLKPERIRNFTEKMTIAFVKSIKSCLENTKILNFDDFKRYDYLIKTSVESTYSEDIKKQIAETYYFLYKNMLVNSSPEDTNVIYSQVKMWAEGKFFNNWFETYKNLYLLKAYSEVNYLKHNEIFNIPYDLETAGISQDVYLNHIRQMPLDELINAKNLCFDLILLESRDNYFEILAKKLSYGDIRKLIGNAGAGVLMNIILAKLETDLLPDEQLNDFIIENLATLSYSKKEISKENIKILLYNSDKHFQTFFNTFLDLVLNESVDDYSPSILSLFKAVPLSFYNLSIILSSLKNACRRVDHVENAAFKMIRSVGWYLEKINLNHLNISKKQLNFLLSGDSDSANEYIQWINDEYREKLISNANAYFLKQEAILLRELAQNGESAYVYQQIYLLNQNEYVPADHVFNFTSNLLWTENDFNFRLRLYYDYMNARAQGEFSEIDLINQLMSNYQFIRSGGFPEPRNLDVLKKLIENVMDHSEAYDFFKSLEREVIAQSEKAISDLIASPSWDKLKNVMRLHEEMRFEKNSYVPYLKALDGILLQIYLQNKVNNDIYLKIDQYLKNKSINSEIIKYFDPQNVISKYFKEHLSEINSHNTRLKKEYGERYNHFSDQFKSKLIVKNIVIDLIERDFENSNALKSDYVSKLNAILELLHRLSMDPLYLAVNEDLRGVMKVLVYEGLWIKPKNQLAESYFKQDPLRYTPSPINNSMIKGNILLEKFDGKNLLEIPNTKSTFLIDLYRLFDETAKYSSDMNEMYIPILADNLYGHFTNSRLFIVRHKVKEGWAVKGLGSYFRVKETLNKDSKPVNVYYFSGAFGRGLGGYVFNEMLNEIKTHEKDDFMVCCFTQNQKIVDQFEKLDPDFFRSDRDYDLWTKGDNIVVLSNDMKNLLKQIKYETDGDMLEKGNGIAKGMYPNGGKATNDYVKINLLGSKNGELDPHDAIFLMATIKPDKI